MSEPIQTRERAQFAIIGIAVTLAALMLVVIATSDGEWWRWLMLGGPFAMVLSASARLRRIRDTGRSD